MKRFFGLMPINEISIEKVYKDIKGNNITIQAGPHGYSILHKYEIISKDIDDTAENNFETALKIAKEKITGLIPKEEYDALIQDIIKDLPANHIYANVTIKADDDCGLRSFENLEVDDIEYSGDGDLLYIKFKKKEDSNDKYDSDQVDVDPINATLSPEEVAKLNVNYDAFKETRNTLY